MTDFIGSIGFFGLTARIKRLSDILNSEARNIYKHLELDIEPNWHLVFLLLKDKELTVTEISKTLGFSHPAIIKITKKMIEKGYLTRIDDPKDARRSLLSLTNKSKNLLPKFENEWQRIKTKVEECSSEEFLKELKHFETSISDKSILQRIKENDD